MQQVFINLFQSKTRLIVILRYILFGSIVLMAAERLRILLSYLQSSETFNNRDILQYYLVVKAAASGINPYLPLDKLAQLFIGNIPYFPHPAPCTPFLAVLLIPFMNLALNQWVVSIFIFEMILLVLLSGMLTILWNDRINWIQAGFILVILLAWYPVANDLAYGQLSILLTVLVSAGLIALNKQRRVLAGVLIGLSVAIKIITWPIIIYFAIKRDWRSLISSVVTILGLNLIALLVIGIGPFMQYYLTVSSQVFSAYRGVTHNWSLWTMGYRLFEGSGSTVFLDFINAPPLISLPRLAPLVSGVLVLTFLIWGLVQALRSKNTDGSFAILVCVLITISPVVWAHYYVLSIIPLVILFRNLQKRAFPAWQTLFFALICLLLFLFNEQIGILTQLINGGSESLLAHNNQISFASSMISWLPILEIIAMGILVWRSGESTRSWTSSQTPT